MAIEFIRPKDLPAASEVNENDSIPVDDGSDVGRATPKEIVDAGRPVASEAEAIAGVINDKAMTPLTTMQAMVADGAGIKAGAEAARDAAEGYRDEAEGFRDSASGYAAAAGNAAGNAAGSAAEAQTYRNQTITYRDAALNSANSAGQFSSDAEDARDKAQAWAESPTAPGDPGTKSAKTWAEEAADSAADAEESAASLDALSFETRASFVAAQSGAASWKDGAVVFAEGIAYRRKVGASDIPGLSGWLPQGDPTPAHFGFVAEGEADNTEPLRSLHEYCNKLGLRPSYEGVSNIFVQANAEIPINTDVDFCGTTLKIIGGIVEEPSWGETQSSVFLVSDPEAGLNYVTEEDFDPSDWGIGSQTFPNKWVSESGWINITPQGSNVPEIGGRSFGDNPEPWRNCYRVVDGRSVFPLTEDLTSVESIRVIYRKDSKNPISLKNLVIDRNLFNHQRVFDVIRNLVTIENIFIRGDDTPTDSVSEIIRVYRCGAITLRNVSGGQLKNNNVSGSKGTYVVHLVSAASVAVHDCYLESSRDAGFSSGFITTTSNGVDFFNCVVNRIDIHWNSYNYQIVNCKLISKGLTIGSGGGYYRVRGTVFIQTNTVHVGLVNTRVDYSGDWRGTISVEDCHIKAMVMGTSILDFGTYPVGMENVPVSLPQSISIRNVMVEVVKSGASVHGVDIVNIKVAPNSEGVRCFQELEVSGVRCNRNMTVKNVLDMNNMHRPPLGDRPTVLFRDVSSFGHSAYNFFHMPERSESIPSEMSPSIVLDNCGQLVFEWEYFYNSSEILKVINTNVRRLIVPEGVGVTLSNCDLSRPIRVSGEDYAPLGYQGSIKTRGLVIQGGFLYGAFDLTKVKAVSGLFSRASDGGGANLPSGLTNVEMLSGWRA